MKEMAFVAVALGIIALVGFVGWLAEGRHWHRMEVAGEIHGGAVKLRCVVCGREWWVD